MKHVIEHTGSIPIDTTPLPHALAGTDQLDKVLALVFGLAGAIAVLVIVIGGVRYILSRGDPSSTAQAKNTIIYGIVGLIVVMVAGSVVALIVNVV